MEIQILNELLRRSSLASIELLEPQGLTEINAARFDTPLIHGVLLEDFFL